MQRMVSARNIEIIGKWKKLSPTKSFPLSESPIEDIIRLKDEIGIRSDNTPQSAIDASDKSLNLPIIVKKIADDASMLTQNSPMKCKSFLSSIIRLLICSDDELKIESDTSESTITSTTTLAGDDKEQGNLQLKSRSTFLRYLPDFFFLSPESSSF
jgi:hypothetical protein